MTNLHLWICQQNSYGFVNLEVIQIRTLVENWRLDFAVVCVHVKNVDRYEHLSYQR